MPSEIVININTKEKILFQYRNDNVLEVSFGDILEPQIIGYKIYTMDGHSVKEPVVKYIKKILK